MQKRALIIWGGWEGHEPEQTANIVRTVLEQHDFDVTVSTNQELWAESLDNYDLLIPNVSHGAISPEQERGLLTAVKNGAGFAGWHGGAGDSFRGSPAYQYMVGGQWVAHPGNIIHYTVNIADHEDPVTRDIPDFDMHSEQYYMHVDPSNQVLATTTFGGEHDSWINGTVMPVVWKRTFGNGRVFYSSLGHVAKDLQVPEALQILERGMLWATR